MMNLFSLPLKQRGSHTLLLFCFAACLLIFILDVNLRLGFAAPVLYIPIIWLGIEGSQRFLSLVLALFCCSLTITGLFLSPPGFVLSSTAVLNRVVFVMLIAFATYMLLERRGSMNKLDRLSRVASRTRNAVVITDTHGRIEWVNEGFKRMTGYTPEQVVGRRPQQLLQGPDSDQSVNANIRTALANRQEFRAENLNYRKDGTRYWVEIEAEPLFDEDSTYTGYFAIETDITERKRANEQMQGALREKEVLLKEIHHRVKNNLQMISSIFSLQSRRTELPEVKSLLRDSENRIRAIALLHETLYRSEDLACINLEDYLREVVSVVLSYYHGNVIPDTTINATDIHLPLDQAIPAGLIINELVTNSLKHAFSRPALNENPEIKVSVLEQDKSISINVTDNGYGLPKDFDLQKSKTLGARIVNTLVEQLQGDIVICGDQGTSFHISFPLLKEHQYNTKKEDV